METRRINSKDIPEISIIVPIYNAEEYLKRCIDSVRNQTFTNYELLLINDGSIDNSWDICNSEAQKDERIHVINQKNSGVSKARNNALDCSKGHYIIFLDADDWLEQAALEVLLNEITKYNADIVCASHIIHKRFNRRLAVKYENSTWKEKEFVSKFDSFFRTVATAPWGKLYKREIVEDNSIRFPENIPYGEDTIFNLNYYKYCDTVRISDKMVYNYNFTNENSAMKRYYPQYIDYMQEILFEYKQFYIAKQSENLYLKIESETEIYFFEMILDYYLLSNLSKKDKVKKIEEIMNALKKIMNNADLGYMEYIKNENWIGIYKMWVRQNKGKIFREFLKDLL